jgi:hypothetical protein
MWYSAFLVIAVICIYAMNVLSALSMDPTSYNCTSDSMMKQICADPYGSSVIWTIIFVTLLGFPFAIIWQIIGIILLTRRLSRKSRATKKLP